MQVLEKIMEEIEQRVNYYKEHATLEYVDICAGLREAEGIIRKHMNDGWIPVEERLPDNNEDVLVTTDEGLITFGYFSHGKWITDQEPDYPIAWIPLPEAYLPERSDNHDRE